MSIPRNATETPAPQICPICGQPLRPCELPLCVPYDARLSSILEWLDVANDAIKRAKALVETEALP
jgi:hypothetical protein